MSLWLETKICKETHANQETMESCLGGSLSKKCNGNHEHGPCAGRETKETQLHTSIIVGVILRRFRARARRLKPAPLKLALACITRGRSRKHQATASGICTTPTAQPRCCASRFRRGSATGGALASIGTSSSRTIQLQQRQATRRKPSRKLPPRPQRQLLQGGSSQCPR